MGADSLAWPIDLLDFWLREPSKLGQVRAYKLNAENNPITSSKTYVTQALAVDATPIERKHLANVIRVDFVAAQRGLGSEEAELRSASGPHRIGMFSNQLLKFARQHLNVASTGHGQRADLIKAVAEAQRELDKKIHEAIADSVEEVKVLGYPGLHDPQEIRFRTRIQTADLLDHGTAVQYSMQKESIEELLPEHSIGLGYQNLQSLSYQLVSFKAARLRPEKGAPAPVHLVLIEEPEAHLHVQVQRIFPDKAHKLIEENVDEDGEEVEPPIGALGAVARAAANAGNVAELVEALHKVMHSSLNKGELAASIFEKLSAAEPVVCPKYIADALAWLSAHCLAVPQVLRREESGWPAACASDVAQRAKTKGM